MKGWCRSVWRKFESATAFSLRNASGVELSGRYRGAANCTGGCSVSGVVRFSFGGGEQSLVGPNVISSYTQPGPEDTRFASNSTSQASQCLHRKLCRGRVLQGEGWCFLAKTAGGRIVVNFNLNLGTI